MTRDDIFGQHDDISPQLPVGLIILFCQSKAGGTGFWLAVLAYEKGSAISGAKNINKTAEGESLGMKVAQILYKRRNLDQYLRREGFPPMISGPAEQELQTPERADCPMSEGSFFFISYRQQIPAAATTVSTSRDVGRWRYLSAPTR